MGKTLDDDEHDKMTDEELVAKWQKAKKDAEQWDEENPDPQR